MPLIAGWYHFTRPTCRTLPAAPMYSGAEQCRSIKLPCDYQVPKETTGILGRATGMNLRIPVMIRA